MGRPAMAIRTPIISGVDAGQRQADDREEDCDQQEGLHQAPARPARAEDETAHAASLYSRLGEWLQVQGELNESGVFDGPISRRAGFAGGPREPG